MSEPAVSDFGDFQSASMDHQTGTTEVKVGTEVTQNSHEQEETPASENLVSNQADTVMEHQPTTSGGTDEPEATDATGNGSADEILHTFVELDTSTFHSCYEVNSLDTSQFVHATKLAFGNDPTRTIIRPRRGQTTWRIETKKIEQYENIQELEYNGQKLATVYIKTETMKVSPATGKVTRQRWKPEKKAEKEDRSGELLITLDGADTPLFSSITDEEITKKIVETGIGKIKVPLQRQPHQLYKSEFTGNKFFVLQDLNPGDVEKLPQSFDFFNNQVGFLRMWLRYRGKKRRCRWCNDFHDGDCPEEAKVREMEAERKQRKQTNKNHLPIKTYTSSVGRHLAQSALVSDVDAMSGATTGNILNAIEIDTESKSVGNILIIAGQNEIQKPVPPEEFLWALKTKEQRLTELAKVKKIGILAPPTRSRNFVTPEEIAKYDFFTESLLKIQKENENIQVWDNPCEYYESEDGRHPTVDQTLQIVNELHTQTLKFFESPLILDAATPVHLTSSRMYSEVNSLYKYGCAGCNKKDRNKWFHLCDHCREALKTDEWVMQAVKKFEEAVTAIEDAENPPLTTESDGEQTSCEICKVELGSAAEIREHYDQKHPEVQPPTTGDDIREKFKNKKPDDADKTGRRKKAAPQKSL